MRHHATDVSLSGIPQRYHRIVSAPYTDTLTRATVDYTPTDTRAFDTPPTDAQTFYDARARELDVIRKCASTCKCHAVFAKADATHKRLCAIVAHDARGSVWIDVMADYSLIPRCIVNHVSEATMRAMLGAPDNIHVYAQDAHEFIRASERRARHHKNGHTHDMRVCAPHDRRPQQFMQRGRKPHGDEYWLENSGVGQPAKVHAQPYRYNSDQPYAHRQYA